jgi:ubiquinone biosynthesis accessory factor UbiJ
MNKPPFLSSPQDWFSELASRWPAPPAWLRAELSNRLLLAINHVLQQEPQAMERLRRHLGKRLQLRWGRIELVFVPTRAGLLSLGESQGQPDLVLTLTEDSPLVLAQAVFQGSKPSVAIQGDVQLAAEIGWLVDNVRWDAEEDLARLFGDVAAHGLMVQGRALMQALRVLAGQAAAGAGQVREHLSRRGMATAGDTVKEGP